MFRLPTVRIRFEDLDGKQHALLVEIPDGPIRADIEARQERLIDEFAATELARRLRNREPVKQDGVPDCPDAEWKLFQRLQDFPLETALDFVREHTVNDASTGETVEEIQRLLREWSVQGAPVIEKIKSVVFNKEEWQRDSAPQWKVTAVEHVRGTGGA